MMQLFRVESFRLSALTKLTSFVTILVTIDSHKTKLHSYDTDWLMSYVNLCKIYEFS